MLVTSLFPQNVSSEKGYNVYTNSLWTNMTALVTGFWE